MIGTLKLIASPAYCRIGGEHLRLLSTIYTDQAHPHRERDGGYHHLSLYVGAMAGSTGGLRCSGHSVAANSEFDYYCVMKLLSTEFLTGAASAATSLVITVEGELVVV
jgi:hypothetical protein